MLKAPMAKRHRGRTRARREPTVQRHAVAPERTERAEREASPVPRPAAARPGHRPPRSAVRSSRSGYARAAGDPSQALERAAVAERTFVTKDFRRLGLVIAACVVLLIVSGIVEGMLVR